MRAAIVLPLIFCVLACEREERRFSEIGPASSIVSTDHPLSPMNPGVDAPLRPGTSAPPRVDDKGPYDDQAWAVAEGARLYVWYGCAGCHANGGGGMGPALMDEEWRYGSSADEIFRSVVEGRPNGMPSFRGKIPDAQLRQIVAFVRSLSGLLRDDVEPGRNERLDPYPPSNMRDQVSRTRPRPEAAP
jgi:cytochrome c oxidase cbb3-type subunit III